MKMDLDLIRKLLLFIEEKDTINSEIRLQEFQIIKEHSIEEIAYHLALLNDAGYIEGKEIKAVGIYDYWVKRMTIEGHQYLNNIRDDTIWNKTKEKLKQVSGTVSLEIVNTVATNVLKTALGI